MGVNVYINVLLAFGFYVYATGSNSGDKLIVNCKGKEISVSANAVQKHLDHGDSTSTDTEGWEFFRFEDNGGE